MPPSAGGSTPISARVTAGRYKYLFLIASDIQAARDDLVAHGVEVSEVFRFAGLNRVDAKARLSGPRSGPSLLRVVRLVQQRDGNWPVWYAIYIVAEQTGQGITIMDDLRSAGTRTVEARVRQEPDDNGLVNAVLLELQIEGRC